MAPLVFPYVCSFAVLDSTGQSQGVIHREPTDRTELPTRVELLAQVKADSLARLAMWAAGRDIEQQAYLYAHRRDLTRRGLIDATTGYPTTPRIGDRLDTIRKRGKVVIQIKNPPGGFVDSVTPLSFGPGGGNAIFEIRLNARRSAR